MARHAVAVRLLADARAARREVADDEHDPEGPTVAFEFARADALRSSAEGDLHDIHIAVARLDAGTYGHCENCGDTIPNARLRARPTAALCLSCAKRRDGTGQTPTADADRTRHRA